MQGDQREGGVSCRRHKKASDAEIDRELRSEPGERLCPQHDDDTAADSREERARRVSRSAQGAEGSYYGLCQQKRADACDDGRRPGEPAHVCQGAAHVREEQQADDGRDVRPQREGPEGLEARVADADDCVSQR